MTLSKPTKFMKEYYEKNGELTCTEEEWQKIHELIISMRYGALEIKEDEDVASEEVSKRRMKICLGCPQFYIRDNGDKSCETCGCNLDYKTVQASEYCPETKWFIDTDTTLNLFKKALEIMNKKRIPEWYQMLSAEESEEILANERK